jgi:hypothetical protein
VHISLRSPAAQQRRVLLQVSAPGHLPALSQLMLPEATEGVNLQAGRAPRVTTRASQRHGDSGSGGRLMD